jgi:hypothetical protein
MTLKRHMEYLDMGFCCINSSGQSIFEFVSIYWKLTFQEC